MLFLETLPMVLLQNPSYSIPAVLGLLALPFGFVAHRRILAMRQRQETLVQGLKGRRYWRINLRRPGRVPRWPLIGFQGKGVLIDDGDSVCIHGHWHTTGAAFAVVTAKPGVQIEWLGRQPARSGGFCWGQIVTAQGTLLFAPDLGWHNNAEQSRQALYDIFHSAFPGHPLTEEDTHEFEFSKNPRSRGVIAAIVALLLFALWDGFLHSDYPLADAQLAEIVRLPPVWLALLVGLPGLTALGQRALAAGRVPAREALALGVLLALAVAAAALPAVKRIDRLLAQKPAQTHAYRVAGAGMLEPVDTSQGLPVLKFPEFKKYLQQLPPGSDYPVPLVHGPMGLWQLDRRQFEQPIIEHYQKKAAAGSQSE